MLTDLIPAEAILPHLALDPATLTLRDELAAWVTATVADLVPLEASAFIQRLLTTFCQDGTPTGLALHPSQTHPHPRSGQMRRVPPDAWQPRTPFAEPLWCALARRIVTLTAHAQPELAPKLSQAFQVLDQVSAALGELTQSGRWASLLLTRPRGTDNRIFDFHYYTAGYPAWECLALRLHSGLVAQIVKEADKPPDKRDHNISAYCTAPKALVPLIRADLLVPALAALDEEERLLRDALWQAATRIQGIKPNTRKNYVDKFLDMFHRGAATRPPTTGRSGFRRRWRAPFTEAALDPEADPSYIPDGPRWQELIRQAARDEDTPALGLGLVEDAEEPVEGVAPVVVVEQAQQDTPRRQRPYYLGNRLALDRNLWPDHLCVLQIPELALLYQALRPLSSTDLLTRLQAANRFLMLDFLIHTGRSPEWLAAIALGPPPDPDTALLEPVYIPEQGAICYPPACYIGIPRVSWALTKRRPKNDARKPSPASRCACDMRCPSPPVRSDTCSSTYHCVLASSRRLIALTRTYHRRPQTQAPCSYVPNKTDRDPGQPPIPRRSAAT